MDTRPPQTTAESILTYISGELSARTAVFLDRAEGVLGDANNFKDPDKRQAARLAARWLLENKAGFQKMLHQRLSAALASPPTVREPDISELRILDDERLALSLLRSKLVNNVMEEGKFEVMELESRLNTIQRAGITLYAKAISPGSLADGFLNLMAELDVPIAVQSILLEIYGDRGVKTLIEFYLGVNQFLAKQGIATRPGAAGQQASEQERVIPTLDTKLQRMEDVVNNLSADDWQPGVLSEMFDMPPPYELTPAQKQSIEHVEALFCDVQSDRNISPRIRNQLNRLVIPMLTIRLSQPEQFSTPDNPARVFMRQLATAGYRDQEAPLGDFSNIEIVVDRLVAERGRISESFRSGSEVLHTMARNEVSQRSAASRPGDRADNRSAKTQDAGRKASAEDSRKQVMVEMRETAAGLAMPPFIQQFLLQALGPWMMDCYQRHGPDSAEWRDARVSCAAFFDVLRPAFSGAEHVRKRVMRVNVLLQARSRLESSKLPDATAGEILAGMDQYFRTLNANPNKGAADGASSSVAFLEALPL